MTHYHVTQMEGHCCTYQHDLSIAPQQRNPQIRATRSRLPRLSLPQKQLQRTHHLRIEAKIGDDASKIGKEVILRWNESLQEILVVMSATSRLCLHLRTYRWSSQNDPSSITQHVVIPYNRRNADGQSSSHISRFRRRSPAKMVWETLIFEKASKIVQPRNTRNRSAERSQHKAMLEVSESSCTRSVDGLRIAANSVLDASGLGSTDVDRVHVLRAVDLRESDVPQLRIKSVVVSDQCVLAGEAAVVLDGEHVLA